MTNRFGDWEALFNEGRMYEDKGLLEEAQQCYSTAGRIAGQEGSICWLRLGYLLRDKDDFAGALRSFQEALARDPASFLAHRGVGYCLAAEGRYDEAEMHLLRSLELRQSDLTYVYLGDLYRVTDQASKAHECYRRAIELDDLNDVAHYSIALLKGPTEIDEAIWHLRKAIQIDMEYAPAYRELARMLSFRKRALAEARRHAERAVALDGRDALAHAVLGHVLIRMGEQERSEEAYRRALALEPDDAMFLRCLGGCLTTRGKYDEAQQMFERSLELEPHEPSTWLRYVGLLEAMGKADDAIGVLQKGLEYIPDSEDLMNAIRRRQ